MVPGVRVHGPDARDHDVVLDDLFREVPVSVKLGVPLVYKKMPGTGGDDSHIRSSVIVRLFVDVDDGLAPGEWQYGGRMGPAPPIVLARRDKLPFSQADFQLLHDYVGEWLEEATEAEEDRKGCNERMLNAAAFQAYVHSHKDEWPTAFLSLQFPLGSTVAASGLSALELNGLEGEVAQFARDRVGVRFSERGVVALRPERLELRRAAPEPAAKRQDTNESKEDKQHRAAELQKREALQICQRFVDCLHQDTFPEMGDLHLFGVGCDYRSRAQEVLAVWQGAVKSEGLTAERLAQALQEDSVKELFEATCRDLAKSKNPNATYAMELIKNNFAALEWDSL